MGKFKDDNFVDFSLKKGGQLKTSLKKCGQIYLFSVSVCWNSLIIVDFKCSCDWFVVFYSFFGAHKFETTS